MSSFLFKGELKVVDDPKSNRDGDVIAEGKVITSQLSLKTPGSEGLFSIVNKSQNSVTVYVPETLPTEQSMIVCDASGQLSWAVPKFGADELVMTDVKNKLSDLDTKAMLVSAKLPVFDARIEDLRTDLTSTQTTVSAIKTDLSALESKVTESQSTTTVIQSDVSALQANVGTLQNTVVEIQSDLTKFMVDTETSSKALSDAVAKHDAVINDLSGFVNGIVTESKNSIDAKQEQQISELNGKFADTTASIEKLSETVTKNITFVEAAMDSYEKSLDTNKSIFSSKFDELKDNFNDELKTLKSTVDGKLSEHDSVFVANNDKLADHETRIVSLAESDKRYEQNMIDVDVKFSDVNTRVAAIDDKFNDLNLKILFETEATNSAVSSLRDDYSKTSGVVVGNASKIENLITVIDTVGEKLNIINKAIYGKNIGDLYVPMRATESDSTDNATESESSSSDDPSVIDIGSTFMTVFAMQTVVNVDIPAIRENIKLLQDNVAKQDQIINSLGFSTANLLSRTRVAATKDYDVPEQTLTQLKFDSKTYDVYGAFDTNSSIFTARQKGYYRVCGSVYLMPKSGDRTGTYNIFIYKNGVHHSASCVIGNSYFGAPVCVKVEDTIQLNQGDTIKLYVMQNGEGMAVYTNNASGYTYATFDQI